LNDVQLGSIAARLALEFPSWIERRVERISYPDRSTTRFSVGVMFRWPAEKFFPELSRPAVGDAVYVPLDLLTKDALAALDGTRPDGSPVPILPYAHTVRLAYTGLASIILGEAEKKLKRKKLDPHTHEIIRRIISAPRDGALRLADAAFADTGNELHEILDSNHPARGLLMELAENAMLLVPASYGPGDESVYRYTYLAASPEDEPLRARARQRLRFDDLTLDHSRRPFGRSNSYHLEVEAPPEVEIPRATLHGNYRNDAGHRVTLLIAETGGTHVIDLQARRPTKEVLNRDPPEDPTTRPPELPSLPESTSTQALNEAAAEAEPTPTARDDRGDASIWFRLEPSGTFLVATVVSCLTALLLIAVIVRLRELEGQTGAALLLALPGLTLGYMTKPGEHSFTTRLLGGVRVAALVVGLCSLWVAWILAGGFIHHQGSTGPGFACEAHVSDLNHHPGPHQGWRETADPDIAQLRCLEGKTKPGSTHVSALARDSADVAVVLAVLFAAWLVAGWVFTKRRGDGMLPLADGATPEKAGV